MSFLVCHPLASSKASCLSHSCWICTTLNGTWHINESNSGQLLFTGTRLFHLERGHFLWLKGIPDPPGRNQASGQARGTARQPPSFVRGEALLCVSARLCAWLELGLSGFVHAPHPQDGGGPTCGDREENLRHPQNLASISLPHTWINPLLQMLPLLQDPVCVYILV